MMMLICKHNSAQQWFTAPYLLKLETQYKLSQQGINDVLSWNDSIYEAVHRKLQISVEETFVGRTIYEWCYWWHWIHFIGHIARLKRNANTQYNNESFHRLIWDRRLKEIFVGRTCLEVAVFDTTIVYNDGERGRSRIFDNLRIKPGH